MAGAGDKPHEINERIDGMRVSGVRPRWAGCGAMAMFLAVGIGMGAAAGARAADAAPAVRHESKLALSCSAAASGVRAAEDGLAPAAGADATRCFNVASDVNGANDVSSANDPPPTAADATLPAVWAGAAASQRDDGNATLAAGAPNAAPIDQSARSRGGGGGADAGAQAPHLQGVVIAVLLMLLPLLLRRWHR